MEYVVRIIEAIAWPATVLIGLFIVRNPIIELIPQFKKLKYKELELEFEQNLEELSKRSSESLKNHEIEIKKEPETSYYLQEVNKLSPRTAIIEAWVGLETTAISTALHFKLMPVQKEASFTKAIQHLKSSGVINEENVEIINELRSLRNKAVHEVTFRISGKEAAKFMEVARNQADIIAAESWQKFGGCSR